MLINMIIPVKPAIGRAVWMNYVAEKHVVLWPLLHQAAARL